VRTLAEPESGRRNQKLINARLRRTSASGDPMTPQDVAEEMNAFLWAEHLKADESPTPTTLDHRFVSSYEAGRHWWPSEQYRAAFRHALRVETDDELGFSPKRRRRRPPRPSTPLADKVALAVTDDSADGTDLRLPGTADSRRRAFVLGTASAVGLIALPATLLRAVAQETSRIAHAFERSPLDASTLGSVQDDLHRISTDYVVTSDLPRTLVDTLMVRDRLDGLIERRRLSVSELRESYVLMTAACLLLASVSHDFGEPAAGMQQADAAQVWADLAEVPDLQGWVLCTKAMIDLWRGRPYDVLSHAARGAGLPANSAARRRLAGLEIRALAQAKRRGEALTLLQHAESAGTDVAHSTALAHLGPTFSFPTSRQHYYAAVSYAQLGDLAATERLVTQLGHGDTPPPAHGVWPISWALSRSYLALARLNHRGDDGGPDAALQALEPILTLPDAQRINQLGQVVADIDRCASSPALATSSASRALRAAVQSFRTIPPTKALSS
jgi:hypothetical protein